MLLTKNVNDENISIVNEVGKRLRCAREAMGLSLREFGERFGENFTFLSRIENGKRFPSKGTIKKFAEVLSLTAEQLDALIAVERRKLDPYQMLPEIPPPAFRPERIEAEAEKVLNEFEFRQVDKSLPEGPMPIEDLIKAAYGLHAEEKDFAKEQISGPNDGTLYGCLFPENFLNKERVILVNTEKINGRQLTSAERRVTIAHEAGHYALHYGKKDSPQLLFRFSKAPTYCRAVEILPTKFNLKEEQANIFGACLLMPRKQFLDQWQKMSGVVSKVARHFDVTEAFVLLRKQTLSL
jgi:transcriptional regulator with XRE-family HTH domain